jgi:transposase
MAAPLVSDELWALVEPLLPPHPPRPKGGRPPVPDRACFTGIVFVLKTGIQWEDMPQEMGCGSGMTCWRRLRDWQQAGVFDRLHALILARLEGAGCLDWSRAVVDASLVRAKGVKRGANRPAPTRRTAPARRRSATSSPTGGASRSPS